MLKPLLHRIANLAFKVRLPARVIAAQFAVPQGARMMVRSDGKLIFRFTGRAYSPSGFISSHSGFSLHALEMIVFNGEVTVQEVIQGNVREISLNFSEKRLLTDAAIGWLQMDDISVEVEEAKCQ